MMRLLLRILAVILLALAAVAIWAGPATAAGCEEISGPGSDWCPGVTPPDILAMTGGDTFLAVVVAVMAVVSLSIGVVLLVRSLMDSHRSRKARR